MSQVNIGKQLPANYEALNALSQQAETAVADAGLDSLLAELVKIRASQLNGCAFCLRLHSREAIVKGENADRLAVVAAWWESQYFDAKERAALTIAERVTRIGDEHFAPTQVLDEIRSALDDRQVAAVTWLAIVINAWNRVAIMSHYPVAP